MFGNQWWRVEDFGEGGWCSICDREPQVERHNPRRWAEDCWQSQLRSSRRRAEAVKDRRALAVLFGGSFAFVLIWALEPWSWF